MGDYLWNGVILLRYKIKALLATSHCFVEGPGLLKPGPVFIVNGFMKDLV